MHKKVVSYHTLPWPIFRLKKISQTFGQLDVKIETSGS